MSHLSRTDLVDVVVEEFVDEVHMGQKHATTAVSSEPQWIQDLAHVHTLLWLSVFVSFSHHHAEFLPLVSNHFAATEATHWDDHLLIQSIINMTALQTAHYTTLVQSISQLKSRSCCPFLDSFSLLLIWIPIHEAWLRKENRGLQIGKGQKKLPQRPHQRKTQKLRKNDGGWAPSHLKIKWLSPLNLCDRNRP